MSANSGAACSEILSPELPDPPDALRAAITAAWALDEAEHVRDLLATARQPHPDWGQGDRNAVEATAADLVRRVRARAQIVRRSPQGAIEAFMRQYDLGSEEGVLLMCVAEALLRIPDQDTADRLIRDKLGEADWKRHLGQSDSVLVNASTWGLMLTGHLVDLADETRRDVHGAFKRLVGRVGEPVIRLAVRQAMRFMGHQFVMGRTIEEALARSRKGANAAFRYSFDMLGEAALTERDAQRYLDAYRKAIHAIGRHADPRRQANGTGDTDPADVFAAPSISVKLSALHPRYEHAKRARVLAELGPRVLELAQLAQRYGIGLTVDAEETDRLELSLDLMFQVLSDASLAGWEGFGIVVQAYQKRAPFVIDDYHKRLTQRVNQLLSKAELQVSQVDLLREVAVFAE
ncbi:MAG TPA: proline dehydrogenase family protein, partial [Xanthomonadaceae bacterium]|nr:proline dehydrogenase family protein [Xanthomonadaceae bacterium]